jgi:hypothetical protein
MKLLVDNLDNITGWAGTATIYGLNDHPRYVTGYNTQSIVFQFNAIDSYVQKTFSIDISNYKELIFSVYSQSKGKNDFTHTTDFDYKIDLGAGKEYLMPLYPGFNEVTLDISDITTIDRIRITALHDDLDFIVMSYVVVVSDEIPLDIYDGLVAGIENYRDQMSTYLLGTKNLTTDDATIDLTGFNFVDDYCVIKITDGVNTEYHQLRKHDEVIFIFTELFDGSKILHDYTGASIYLYFPVTYGRDTLEAIVPGITIWSFEPEEVLTSFNLQKINDTWTTNGARERQEGAYFKWPIQIDCESRHGEILAHLATIVRHFAARKYFYVNGRKIQIDIDRSEEQKPNETFDIIPKVLYHVNIYIREDIWQRETLPKTTTINFQATIM